MFCVWFLCIKIWQHIIFEGYDTFKNIQEHKHPISEITGRYLKEEIIQKKNIHRKHYCKMQRKLFEPFIINFILGHVIHFASIFGAYPHLKLDSHNEFHGKIRNNEHISVLVKLKCVPGSFNGFMKYSTCHVKLVYRNLIRIYSRHFKKGI